jgi:hypothetical protein
VVSVFSWTCNLTQAPPVPCPFCTIGNGHESESLSLSHEKPAFDMRFSASRRRHIR